MSATNDVSKAPADHKHFTKMTTFSTKLEWRIDHFDKAVRFYEHNQSISGKTFTLPHFQAVWQVDVYPCGKSGYTPPSYLCFSLRLIGFQTSDGSLSADKTKSIKADYKIYVRSSENEEKVSAGGLLDFKIGSSLGNGSGYGCMTSEEVKKVIHPDGSLLVICEIECLVPEETFSMELSQKLKDESMETLRRELKQLKEDAATFASHKAMFTARCEELQAQVESVEGNLKKAKDQKRTLNQLLRMAIQQKLSLTQRLEDVEMEREHQTQAFRRPIRYPQSQQQEQSQRESTMTVRYTHIGAANGSNSRANRKQ